MRKISILVCIFLLSANMIGQVPDIPWQAELTRITGAEYYNGEDKFDIGKDFTDGIIMLDFSVNRVYVVGNTTNFFILKITERLNDLEKEILVKSGVGSNIYRCKRQGKEWKMDLQYDPAENMVHASFYFKSDDGILRVISFDSKPIPKETAE
jgi:hypothetical protein